MLFLRVQLTIFQHWFRKWLCADQTTSHYLTQWWLDNRRKYASLSFNELTPLTIIFDIISGGYILIDNQWIFWNILMGQNVLPHIKNDTYLLTSTIMLCSCWICLGKLASVIFSYSHCLEATVRLLSPLLPEDFKRRSCWSITFEPVKVNSLSSCDVNHGYTKGLPSSIIVVAFGEHFVRI